MTNRIIHLALIASISLLLTVCAAAQTTGEAPRHPSQSPLGASTAEGLINSLPRAGVARASEAAFSRLAVTRRYTSFLSGERTTVGQVTDAHIGLYTSADFLHILSSPNRPALIAPPFHAKTRAETGSSSIPGVGSATLSRMYHSDSSVASLAAWYARQYGFDFKVHSMPLGNANADTLTVARGVRRVQNSVVTVMIWNPSSSARGRGGRSDVFVPKTSIEVQERAFRPRGDLVAEGPDAVVEMTWKVPYHDLIQRISAKYQIDPHLVAALVQQESNFNPTAMSVDSAMGLTQMIPGTAQMLGVSDPNNPHQALEGGVRYLKMLLRRFKGNVEFALAGYNAGPGNVEKYGGVPPFSETRDYVRRIVTRYKEKAAGSYANTAKIIRQKQ